MASDELKELLQHATSKVDFYELLGVQFEASENDIKRGYRKESIKWHPDKNKDPSAVDKFHALAIARDVLLNTEAKAAYDKARAARIQKQRQHELLDGRRKQMKEDLERRESGFFKRKRQEEDAEEKLQQEIRRLAEDGKRRRMEREERLTREKEEEDASILAEEEDVKPDTTPETQSPEVDRTVIVKWFREGSGENIEKESLSDMFSRFGRIERAFLSAKEKKVRAGDGKHRKLQATGFIIFHTAFAAQAAVDAGKRTFAVVESIELAKKPDSGAAAASTVEEHLPSTPSASPASFSKSWRSSVGATPKTGVNGSPAFSFSPMQNSPSYEEATLARLKAAERKRLEEQIKREEAGGD
jgi:DnaJ homolog subfamily C member 17